MSYEPSQFQSGPVGHFPPNPQGKAPRVPTQSSPTHPGWLSRSLFWTAIIITALPSLVIFPLMPNGSANFAIIFSISMLLGAVLQLILGVVALLLVKNTSWPRRLAAGGIYLLGCLVPLIGTPLVPVILNPSAVGIDTVNIVQRVLAGISLVLVLVSWNITRNRRWWILLVAVICAAITAGVGSVVSTMAVSAASSAGLTGLLIQVVSLVLIFASLGLCHLLARLPGGTVPLPVEHPRGQWSPPQNPAGRTQNPAGRTQMPPGDGGPSWH